MTGKVKWFDTYKGYGFIISEGKEHFVHHSNVLLAGPKTLNPGDLVDFELETQEGGKSNAVNVSVLQRADIK